MEWSKISARVCSCKSCPIKEVMTAFDVPVYIVTLAYQQPPTDPAQILLSVRCGGLSLVLGLA